MKQAISGFLTTLAEFLPKLIGFVVILIVGLIIAKLIAKAIGKLLEKVGFDKAVERGGVKKALEKSKFDASDIVGKLIYYALVLLSSRWRSGCSAPTRSAR